MGGGGVKSLIGKRVTWQFGAVWLLRGVGWHFAVSTGVKMVVGKEECQDCTPISKLLM